MNPVEQIVWLIESRLSERLSDAAIAAETGLSRFAAGRQFAQETGMRVADYARARRLSEAAKQLARTGAPIAAVALGAAYASPEAFTRAFRKEFGTTPETVRRLRDLSNLSLQEPIRMSADLRSPLAGPEIHVQSALDLVGLERHYDSDPLAGIPAQWQEFVGHIDHLDRDRVGTAFGIVRNAAPNMASVSYMCAVPAASGLQPGNGLVRAALPAMRLARFTLRGHISAIKAATQQIFASHLPAAALRPAGPVDLIEAYGPRFDPHSGFGEIGLWVPVAG